MPRLVSVHNNVVGAVLLEQELDTAQVNLSVLAAVAVQHEALHRVSNSAVDTNKKGGLARQG